MSALVATVAPASAAPRKGLSISTVAVRPTTVTTLGLDGWRVLSSADTSASGTQISEPGFDTTRWMRVMPDDAGAPGTEIEALLQNRACPNVFYSTNMKKCFGYVDHIGRVTVPRFAVPWWFRTVFAASLRPGQHATLVINGVVGQADVWVDGIEVATQRSVQGDYVKYTFDVTRRVVPGVNSVAIKVYPNNPMTMFTVDHVDWSQIPPDNNTGIQFPIQLEIADALSVSNDYVTQVDAPDMSSSALTVHTDVTNHSSSPRRATVAASITPPTGAGPAIHVTQTLRIPPASTRTVTFSPASFPALTIEKPLLWWPYQMGRQPLYQLTTKVKDGAVVSGAPVDSFAIRKVTTSLTAGSALAPSGVRRFAVNGVPFLVRGAGWAQNLFLHYSSQNTANQIALVKSIGLNVIRTEGQVMPDNFYQQMDRAGIMINAGFQCCDRWQLPPNGQGVTSHDYRIIYLSTLTIGQRLRNHPSVIDYSWSDNAPTEKQEQVSLTGFARAGFDDPIISSAEYNSSPVLGASGAKEGPYDWVPPSYWYDTSHSSTASNLNPTLTNVGGSWGFDSEQSAGDTVPTMDSINRFLSPTEKAKLWQDPSYNQYHTNYEPGHTGYAFGTLFHLDQAIAQRYGPWSSLSKYVEAAQVQNYEDTRAQFEAFINHWNNEPTPSTGTIYWMLNTGWPSLLWSLYNADYDEAGSFFGAQEANVAVHALYAYDDQTVSVDNLGGSTQSNLTVEAKVYDLAGRLLDHQTSATLTLAPQAVDNNVIHPLVPDRTTAPTTASAYFVELQIRRDGAVIDRNVYWLSTQPDVVNWNATVGNPQAVMSQYSDLTGLRSLPRATLSVRATSRRSSHNHSDDVTTVTVTNTSASFTVGFFLRADVRRGTARGAALRGENEVLPIAWSSNDVTLWPGESETLTATYRASLLKGSKAVVSISGWNVPERSVAAPMHG